MSSKQEEIDDFKYHMWGGGTGTKLEEQMVNTKSVSGQRMQNIAKLTFIFNV